jgi:hypothetical protein
MKLLQLLIESIKQKLAIYNNVESEDMEGEISRSAKDLGIPEYVIKDSLLRGKMVTLTDQMWSKLENTDSYDVKTLDDFIALSKQYGKDYKRIMDVDPKKLPPALVIEYKPGRYYLVGGNTRLMYHRVMGSTPKVILGKIQQ